MVRVVSTLLLALLLLGLPRVVRSAPIDDAAAAATGVPGYVADVDLLVIAGDTIVQQPRDLPALPESAVFIMMLLGVCVLGARPRYSPGDTFY